MEPKPTLPARRRLFQITAIGFLGFFGCARPEVAPTRAGLRAALDGHRPFEARLVGIPAHEPCELRQAKPGSVPGADCALAREQLRNAEALRSWQVKIERSVRATRGSAELVQLDGLRALLRARSAGAFDRAVEALRGAHAEQVSPASANDLAVAHLERASAHDRPVDLLHALELLEEAVTKDPTLPEPAFNRALALERLGLRVQARAAWEGYLALDGSSGWAGEAREHLDGLARPEEIPARDEVVAAVTRGDLQALLGLARTMPSQLREVVLEELLPRWGVARLETPTASAPAERWLVAARAAAAALRDEGGDTTVAVVLAALERPGADLEALARGHAAYGRGRAATRARDAEAARAPLLEAATVLAEAGSPLEGWSEFELAGGVLSGAEQKAAMAAFQLLAQRADATPALRAKALWGQGLAGFRQGRYGEALRAFEEARVLMVAVGETESVAATRGLEGETIGWIGLLDEAWRARFEALSVLAFRPPRPGLHNTLWNAAEAALDEGFPRAAARLSDEDVLRFGDGWDPLLALEAFHRRGLLRSGMADPERALADVEAAEQRFAKLPAGALAERVEVALRLARLEHAAAAQQAVPLADYDRAVEYFEAKELVPALATARLGRARARLAQGLAAEAEADLEAVLRSREKSRAALSSPQEARAFTDTWQEALDLSLEVALAGENGPARARVLLARGRGERAPVPAATPVPAGLTVLEVGLVGDTLLLWSRAAGGESFLPRPVARAELVRRLKWFVDQVSRGRGGMQAEAEELGALLLPEVLPAGGRLCVVLDRELHGLPLGALRVPGEGTFWVERWALVQGVSTAACLDSAAVEVPSPSRTAKLLVRNPLLPVGQPREFDALPGEYLEGLATLPLFADAEVLEGGRATPEALLEALPGRQLVHYAGHAKSVPTNPGSSFLALAGSPAEPSGRLTARELGSKRYPGLELVVLAACESIAPRPRRADGLSGLGRAFLDAGAEAVLGSLWAVETMETKALFESFYEHLARTGDAAESLRSAQLEQLQSDTPNHQTIRTWPAFTLLVGEGRGGENRER